jgi:hypothetical protein
MKSQSILFQNKALKEVARNSMIGNLFFTIAIVMIVIWVVSFFAFQAGTMIHFLLVIALLFAMLALVRK